MSGVENKVIDALSRRVCFLKQLSAEVMGFKRIIDEYESSPDFKEIVYVLKEGVTPEIDGFLFHDRNLFRFRKLCVFHTSLRGYHVWELHVGGLASHFGQKKTIETVKSLFY